MAKSGSPAEVKILTSQHDDGNTSMLQRGFLGFRQFKPSLAHGKNELAEYALAVNEVFQLLKGLPYSQIISSPVAHTGFHRLTRE